MAEDGDTPWITHPARLTLLVTVAVVLAVGALVGWAFALGWRRVLTEFVHPEWEWIAPAVAGEAFAYLGYTAAYREIARAEDGAELKVPDAAAVVSTGFGAFVHAGGFALDRVVLQRAGLSEPEARRRVLGLGALEYAVLAPAALVAALIVYLRTTSVSSSLTLPWVIGVPAGTALTLLVLRFERQVSGWPLLGERLAHGLHAIRLVLTIIASPKRHGLALIGTLTYWSGDIFCLWATLHAFSAHTPPVAQLIVAYATGYALTRRALPLGGAGIVEALLPLTLGLLAIARVPALLAVFAYRLINLWLPIVPALWGIPTLRRLQHA